jgi:hypothetical protein
MGLEQNTLHFRPVTCTGSTNRHYSHQPYLAHTKPEVVQLGRLSTYETIQAFSIKPNPRNHATDSPLLTRLPHQKQLQSTPLCTIHNLVVRPVPRLNDATHYAAHLAHAKNLAVHAG